MIIGPDFVWLHMPKCAGSTLELALRHLLRDRPGIQFDEIDEKSGRWHHNIAARKDEDPSFDVTGKRVLCCIRRLPAWVMSRVMFEITRNEHLIPSREMLVKGRCFESDGSVHSADEYIELFCDDVDGWLRVEFLAHDVAHAFNLKLEDVIEAIARYRIRDTSYVKRTEFWFTDDDLLSLYRANPTWSKLEKRLYGSIAPSALRIGLANLRDAFQAG